MHRNRAQHPKFKVNVEKFEKCDICNNRIKLLELHSHLTDYLNGKSECVMKCTNNKCGHMYTNSVGFLSHINTTSQKFYNKVALENFGLSCDSCGFSAEQR